MASDGTVPEASGRTVKIACEQLRIKLKDCIKQSDCVQKFHRRAADCVQARDGTVPKLCYDLMESFSACKRSMIKQRLREVFISVVLNHVIDDCPFHSFTLKAERKTEVERRLILDR
ncbi:unnamed protein product [Enterobius vermicularis]|uniref:Cytochrome c oxidase assembly factor 5 n=1 Tax=Enterobius vermicularis TaxID=51028 RepID=A0A0N4UXB8_ENTVE|nr:unnamed protein product [Enterobius vermicularis]